MPSSLCGRIRRVLVTTVWVIVVAPGFLASDQQFMRQALKLAARGRGYVEPNPMVGCVIVRGGRVLGSGWHRRFGGPHAEIEALRRVSGHARGATAYVTLEPCCHYGKTPPCCDALIAAGIARVVAAMKDPYTQVSGKGLAKLRKANIAVQSGLLAEEAADLNRPYLTRLVHIRPYVIAKWAQSLDGRIATRKGDSKWISGQAARRRVHQLRSRVDAIVVGINTVLADDPLLTARDVRIRRVAVRIVLDNHLRIPRDCRLIKTARTTPTMVATRAEIVRAKPAVRNALESRGVKILACRQKRGSVSLADLLRRLANAGMTTVLVEGGGRVIGSLFDDHLVDEAHIYTAPIIIGGDAPTGCQGRGIARIADALQWDRIVSRKIGHDHLVEIRNPHAPVI